MDALLWGRCRSAVRRLITAVLRAVLRRRSLAQLHLETSSGGEQAELVRLSLSASSHCGLFIAAVYYFVFFRCFWGPALHKSCSAPLEEASLMPFASPCPSESLNFCRSPSWWADKVWYGCTSCTLFCRLQERLPVALSRALLNTMAAADIFTWTCTSVHQQAAGACRRRNEGY